MAVQIGTVSQVVGEVFAVSANGIRRPLIEGDRVFAGEQLVTGLAGAVAVTLGNGQTLTLGRDSSMGLSQQLLAGNDVGNTAVAPEPVPIAPSEADLTDVEKLQAAIEAGVDPTQVAEATAAGPGSTSSGAPGGLGGGHSFVMLDAVGGALDPVIGFPTVGLSAGPLFPDPEPVDFDEPQQALPPVTPPVTPPVVPPVDEPDFTPGLEVEYEDATGSVSTGPATVDEAALANGSNPASSAEQARGRLIVDSPDGVSALQIQDVDGNWIDVTTGGVVQGQYGTLLVDAAGNWTYTLTGNTLNHSNPNATGAADQVGESFAVRVFDLDGDVSPTVQLDVQVNDDGPQMSASAESVSVRVDEDDIAGGISDGDGVTQSASGSAGTLTGLVDFGADGLGSFGLSGSASALASLQAQGLTSGGVALSYSVVGNTLTATAGSATIFTLTVAADGSFTFTLTGPLDHPQADGNDDELLNVPIDFSGVLAATDGDGDSLAAFTPGSFLIDVEDDVPQASADSNSVNEGALLTVNAANGVLGNDLAGADGFAATGAVVGVRAAGGNTTSAVLTGVGTSITGAHGTLTLLADGSYTYQSNANTISSAATDVFVYTIKDGDGDLSTTTLTINLSDSGLLAPDDQDVQVFENALDLTRDGDDLVAGTVTGSLPGSTGETDTSNQLNASGGFGSLTYSLVGSQTGTYGTIQINSNGSYTYTLSKPYTSSPEDNDGSNVEQGRDSFTYQVTDANGNTQTGTITVDIVDDTPTARVDSNTVSEGALLSVNAANGVLHNDTAGADGFAASGGVVGVRAAGGNTSTAVLTGVGNAIAGQYGTLILQADGSYTYQSNANAIDHAETDVFVYTIKDGDGDLSTTTLTINLSDSGLCAPDDNDAKVYEHALDTNQDGFDLVAGTVTGSLPNSNGETDASNQLNASGGFGSLTYSLVGSQTGTYGTIQLNSNGSYTYTLSKPYTSNPAIDNGANVEQGRDSFTYEVRDAYGNTQTGTITVDIVDDTPTAHDDSPACIIQSPPVINVTLVLDTSGSMAYDGKLAALKTAVLNLAQAYAALDAPIHVNLVTFDNGSSNVGDFSFNTTGDSGYLNLIAAVNALRANGLTNYEAALATAEAQILLDVNAAGASSTQQHKLYFISDGAPSTGNTAAGLDAWQSFKGNIDGDGNASTNAFQAYAIGINVSHGTYLSPVASSNGYITATPEDLSATLVSLASFGGEVSGNVLANDVAGADGVGRIESVQVAGQTFTLSADGNSITPSGTGSTTHAFDIATKVLTLNTELGTLKIDLQGADVGTYSFVAKANLAPSVFGDDGAVKQLFTYTLVDGDGDKDSANLEICIRSDQAVLVVGDNVSDISGSTTDHVVKSPFDDGKGQIVGVGGKDVLVGDVGGGTGPVVHPAKNYNIALILDRSGSMADNPGGSDGYSSRLALLKAAVRNFLDQMHGHTGTINLAIIAFNDSASLLLSGTRAEVEEQVDNLASAFSQLSATGATNYEAAMKSANAWFAGINNGYHNLAYFLTDGNPTVYNGNTNSGSTTNAADVNNALDDFATLSARADVHAIGIGNGVNQSILNFFDDTSVVSSGSVNVGGTATTTAPYGQSQIVTTAGQLFAVLDPGSTTPGTLAPLGNDHLIGNAGDDLIFGDSLNTTWIAGYQTEPSGYQVLIDHLTAVNGGSAPSQAQIIDFISANAQQLGASVAGVGGNDILDGGAGNDWLFGQGGDDVLIGGLGNDHLSGGAGKDTFVWRLDDADGGTDHITDFSIDTAGINSDVLDLSQLLSGVGNNPNDLQHYLDFAFSGTTTTIDVRTAVAQPVEQTIVLDNVNLSTLYGTSNEATIITHLLDDNALKTV